MDKLIITYSIPQIINGKEAKKIITIPKFKAGGLPISIKDLELYFKRRIPQMIAFIL